MDEAIFARGKVTPQCLSRWQAHRHLVGTLNVNERDQVALELQTCARCQSLVEHTRAAHAASLTEPVPSRLVDLAQERVPSTIAARSQRGRWGAAATAMALSVVALIVVRPPWKGERRDERSKGTPATEVTFAVARGDRILAIGVAAAALPQLKTGDQLRLRVPESPYVILEGKQKTGWVRYFAGMPDAQGWLPMAVAITPQGRSQLRITRCKTGPTATAKEGHCDSKELEL